MPGTLVATPTAGGLGLDDSRLVAQHLHLCPYRVLLSAPEQSVEAIGESPEIVGCLRTR